MPIQGQRFNIDYSGYPNLRRVNHLNQPNLQSTTGTGFFTTIGASYYWKTSGTGNVLMVFDLSICFGTTTTGSTVTASIGLGIDSLAAPVRTGIQNLTSNIVSANVAITYPVVLSPGIHYFNMMWGTAAGQNLTMDPVSNYHHASITLYEFGS